MSIYSDEIYSIMKDIFNREDLERGLIDLSKKLLDEMRVPVCPFCKTTMDIKRIDDENNRFGYWSCSCINVDERNKNIKRLVEKF